jgi:putative hydrolase of the HAD superfamily
MLRATLNRLPGRKFVFSNAPVHYAEAVLRALDIFDLFSDVYAIEHTRYRPKPDTFGFLRLCRSHHLRPRRCIMVEDNLDNLRTAKRLGMKTVWVSAAGTLRGKAPGYVDQTVRSMARLPSMLGQLQ